MAYSTWNMGIFGFSVHHSKGFKVVYSQWGSGIGYTVLLNKYSTSVYAALRVQLEGHLVPPPGAAVPVLHEQVFSSEGLT